MKPLKPLVFVALGILGAVARLSAANLITNPGFEAANLAGWTTWGSAITQSSEQAHGGSYSCLNTARTASWQGCVQDLTGRLRVGVTYRVEAWMRLRNASSANAQILIKTTYAGADHYASSATVPIANGAWTRLAFSYTHSGTGTIVTYFYAIAGATTVEFFVDDVLLDVAYDPQAVTVDLSATRGAATRRGSGFLFGVSGTEPAAARFEALQPGLVRFDAALGNPNFRGPDTGFASAGFMNRIKATGARMQVIISDEYQWVNNYHNTWGWPGDPAHGGYTSYQLLDLVINNLMDAAAASFPATDGWPIEWDIWNEPDWVTFWGRNQAQFFNTWKHAVEVIRARDPNAVVVGPSAASYNPANNGQFLKAFLLFARDNQVLPNVLSWHNLGNVTNLTPSVTAMRIFMAANNIPVLPIDLNEYIGNQEFTNAARHVTYLTELERAGVRRAAHAVWDEVPGDYWSNGVQPGHLCHLLTRDAAHSARAVWHVYQAYVALAGDLVSVSPSQRIDGLAAIDTNGTVRMVLANDSTTANNAYLTVNRLELLPYYSPTGLARVLVERIPNTGMAALAAPLTVTNMVISLTTNTLVLPLTFGPAEVLLVRIQGLSASWNAAADFTIAGGATGVGPGNVWSYGYANASATQIGFMPFSTPNGFGIAGLEAWQIASADVPAIVRNTTETAIGFIAPGKLMVNPGSDGHIANTEQAVIWWTAPVAGSYECNLNWTFPDTNADGVIATVTRNLNGGGTGGTLLASATLTAANRAASWTQTLGLTPGENLAFAVGPVRSANYGSAGTQIDLGVTRVVAPQPSLSFARSGTSLTLSWPLPTDPAYVLEAAGQPTAGAWTNVPGVAGNRVTVTMAGTRKYFRLRKP